VSGVDRPGLRSACGRSFTHQSPPCAAHHAWAGNGAWGAGQLRGVNLVPRPSTGSRSHPAESRFAVSLSQGLYGSDLPRLLPRNSAPISRRRWAVRASACPHPSLSSRAGSPTIFQGRRAEGAEVGHAAARPLPLATSALHRPAPSVPPSSAGGWAARPNSSLIAVLRSRLRSRPNAAESRTRTAGAALGLYSGTSSPEDPGSQRRPLPSLPHESPREPSRRQRRPREPDAFKLGHAGEVVSEEWSRAPAAGRITRCGSGNLFSSVQREGAGQVPRRRHRSPPGPSDPQRSYAEIRSGIRSRPATSRRRKKTRHAMRVPGRVRLDCALTLARSAHATVMNESSKPFRGGRTSPLTSGCRAPTTPLRGPNAGPMDRRSARGRAVAGHFSPSSTPRVAPPRRSPPSACPCAALALQVPATAAERAAA